MKYIIITLLLVTKLLSGQNLGEPVFDYTDMQVINDTMTYYEKMPTDLNSPDREEYIEINGICKQVKLIFYGFYVDRVRGIVEDNDYIEEEYNSYLGPYGYVRAVIKYQDGSTVVTFTLR